MENKTTGIVSLLGENRECAVVQNDNIEVEERKKKRRRKEQQGARPKSHTQDVLVVCWKTSDVELVLDSSSFFFFCRRGQHERK